MKEIIERFIRTGKTTAEIQSEIIEFPDDITSEYLEKLGFEEIDAIKLKWKLRQNDRIREAEIKAAKGRRILLKEGGYQFSPNADPYYILLDTSALLTKRGRDVIRKSKKDIILEATIQEIDNVFIETLRKNKKDLMDNANIKTISEYKRTIFNQSKFKKRHIECEDKYCDTKILYYINSVALERRPTLLTADYNLASRADAYGFEYIFVYKTKGEKSKKQSTEVQESDIKVQSTEVQESNIKVQSTEVQENDIKAQSTEVQESDNKSKSAEIEGRANKNQQTNSKEVIHGIKFEVKYNKITVNGFNKRAKTFFVKGTDSTLSRKKDERKIENIDLIIMLLRQRGNREVRIIKIKIVNNQIKTDEEIIKFVNEIYQSKVPEEIEEEARMMLV